MTPPSGAYKDESTTTNQPLCNGTKPFLYSVDGEVIRTNFVIKGMILKSNKVDVLHVRLTELHAAHQNLPLPPNQTLPLKQYQYQGRLW